ncbi:unnamed protein product [Timema podura]|uniref:Uncharacterized protein n=1 Tax=Timema podura TaxID=61482 RepID=A0ABN7PF19_TIMPD|nr:unnamed protein product [Timema podura]
MVMSSPQVKKYNFDMIKRVVSSGQILMMCSLNCLTLYKVSINAVSSKRIKCDMCNGVAQAQYHLTNVGRDGAQLLFLPVCHAVSRPVLKVTSPYVLRLGTGSCANSHKGVDPLHFDRASFPPGSQ